MSFLRAEWRKLALINYEVDPAILHDLVPTGTSLDLWKGKCYVSLVGFLFKNTRLLGFKIPFHVNFEEVNLRFYVTRGEGEQLKRGVVFIKEIVPKPALTFIANTVYREHYQTRPMRHRWESDETSRTVQYAWKIKGNWNQITLRAQRESEQIAANSEAEFITEHYWGYSRVHADTTYEYEVTHPRWLQYPVIQTDLDVDFGATYGEKFAFLNMEKPVSVMLAEGSAITVENRRKLGGS